MNKNIVTLALAVLLNVLQSFAMENGALEVVETVVKNPALTIEILKSNTPTEIFLETVNPSQHYVPTNLAQKIMYVCKKHPFSIATCIAVVAAVVIYNTVPGVREKISSLFGISSYKPEDIEFEEHVLPLEKL
jgi:hypothetical protein